MIRNGQKRTDTEKMLQKVVNDQKQQSKQVKTVKKVKNGETSSKTKKLSNTSTPDHNDELFRPKTIKKQTKSIKNGQK